MSRHSRSHFPEGNSPVCNRSSQLCFRLVAKKQQSVPAKRRLLHSRVPPRAAVTNAVLTNAIGDGLQKKGKTW